MRLRRASPLWWLRNRVAQRVERPEDYSRLQRAVGSARVWEVFIGEYLRPAPGMRVLDIGCGPADVLAGLPELHYLGVDRHAPYIEAARRRYGGRARFEVGEADAVAGDDRFDVVLLLGLLHHLDDNEARTVAETAARLLNPGGRVLTLDGCRSPGQSVITRALFQADRGDHTRDLAGYQALLRPALDIRRAELRHDLLRLPYTYGIIEAAVPSPAPGHNP